jgi:hypothetical protein
MKKQTTVGWLIEYFKKLQSKGEKMSWTQIIQIVELTKEMERDQIIDAFYNARKNKLDCQIWNCEGSQKAYETFDQYYTETFEQ